MRVGTIDHQWWYEQQLSTYDPKSVGDTQADLSGVLLGKDYVWYLEAAPDEFFPQNFFYQKQCKYAMNKGLLRSEVPFYSFFREKVTFYIFAGHCLQSLK